MKFLTATALALSLTGLLSSLAPLDDGPSAEEKAIIAAELPSYPFKTCVVSKRALDSGAGPFDLVIDGHLVRVCCPGCEGGARGKAGEIRRSIERAVIARDRAHWPMKECPVSGEAYDKAGSKSVELVHGTRYVKLCCQGCVKVFEDNPSAFMEEIDAAYIKSQLDGYPLKSCPVSKRPLGDAPVDLLYGTTLVRLCCKGCERGFKRDPEAIVREINKAWAKAHAEKAEREAEKK